MGQTQRDINKHKIMIKIRRKPLIPFLRMMISRKTYLNDGGESLSALGLCTKYVVP